MHMHIRHETLYRYERPVKYSVQSLHLTPRRDLSQRALAWNITAPGRRLEQVDAHGNISHLLTIEEPHREIRIVVQGVVETADTEGRQDDGPLSPLAYLSPTALTAPDDEMRVFAHAAAASGRRTRARARSALAEAVLRRRALQARHQRRAGQRGRRPSRAAKASARITRTCTSPRRASLGMPARYVSGYLYTGDASDAASHAWVDVWLGADVGWQSIDVTHQRPAVAHLLPARGRPRLPGRGAGARRASRRRRREDGGERAGGGVGATAAAVR